MYGLFTYFIIIWSILLVESHRDHSRSSYKKEGFKKDDYLDADGQPKNTLREDDFIRDTEHLKEHLQEEFNFDPNNCTAEELEFYYFKIHDFNNDKRLDGLELLGALLHASDEQLDLIESGVDYTEDRMPSADVYKYNRKIIVNHIISTVDRTLSDDDTNMDGYIDYTEFVKARKVSAMLEQIANIN